MQSTWITFAFVVAAALAAPFTHAQDSTPREHFPASGGAAGLPFSSAVLAGNTLYLSGMGGLVPGTRQVPHDPAVEAKNLMEVFKAALARADMRMDDLVSVTVYCPDLELYGVFNQVYRSYFGDKLPARAFIGSGPLLFGMRFETQGIAVK